MELFPCQIFSNLFISAVVEGYLRRDLSLFFLPVHLQCICGSGDAFAHSKGGVHSN